MPRESEPDLIVEIETARGYAYRHVLPASALSVDMPHGIAAEFATRAAAAVFGLPDFVFRPRQQRQGSGIRELGDTILAVADRAAAVQVKARTAASDNDHREQQWLDQKIEEGARQAAGTIRTLTRAGEMTLTNERGKDIRLSATDRPWVKVVVLDHPGLAGYVPKGEAVVLLRRDWEFLFEQLKSTAAVLGYLHRLPEGEHVELGTEPVRYYEYAMADAAAPAGPVDARLVAIGSRTHSSPILPEPPAGLGDDAPAFLIRIVLEDIAVMPAEDEQGRFDGLSAIDAIPVTYRAELAADVLSWLKQVAEVKKGRIMWRFRNIPYTAGPLIMFGTTTKFDEEIAARFRGYVELRHQQHLEL